MRIAICDDDKLDRDIIRELLQLYLEEKSIACEISEYEGGRNLIYEVQDGGFFDLVILDIYMEDMLGIDVARRLRELRYGGEIVFLTTSSAYAVDGYEVGAAGYLLKPHSYRKLSATMDRVLQDAAVQAYYVHNRSAVIRIPHSEILYVESSNTKCLLHRTDGTVYTVYKRLDQVEAELGDPRFLRCHQSYLVNMNEVQEADREFVLTSGDVVPIRQRGLREIRQAYLDYIVPRMHPAERG